MGRMKRGTAALGAALLLVACFAGGAQADRPVDETRALNADGVVEFEMISGSVRVIGWDKQEVRVEGELEDDVEELVIDGDGDRLVIEVKLPDHVSSNDADAFLTLHVPKGCEAEISTISAGIEVEKLLGELIVESVSGNIEIDGGMTETEVDAVSGSVTLRGGKGRVQVTDVSGGIELIGFEGSAELGTVSGEILVDGGKIARLEIESVSGDVEFHGDLDESGRYRFDVHSGDVTLAIDGDADFDVETFSGDIDNAFGSDGRRTSEYTPGRELEFRTGGGGADVRIETFSGDVTIKKK